MRSLLCMVLAGVVLSSATAGADDGRRGHDRRGHDRRHEERYDDHRGHERHGGYFSAREVRVIREYYRPRYKRIPPGHAKRYYRNAYLPADWHRCVEPIPVYVERGLVVLPHGYHRGIIDGHVVVFNSRGLIIDVAMLF
jgi:Ni/Co efflux regulator RcnB